MTSSSDGNPWIQLYTPKNHAKFRLFCFPYAGGGAVLFHPWRDRFPPEVDLCPIELPGRGKRFTEKPFTSLPPLIEALAQGIEPYLTLPFAFFGHSMGALVSFELARYLRERQMALPGHLFVSAFRAPQLPDPDPPIHQLPDAEFIEELKQLNGTPQAVLEHAELMQLLLATLRTDFAVCETYVYREEAPLPCPLSVFGGMQDNEVNRAELEQWRKQTTSNFSLRMFPGDHFFLFPMQGPLLRAIAQDLKPYLK
jgi:medium-chain acyl-[acyl-carrier-protein] hydrolase